MHPVREHRSRQQVTLNPIRSSRAPGVDRRPGLLFSAPSAPDAVNGMPVLLFRDRVAGRSANVSRATQSQSIYPIPTVRESIPGW